MKVGLIGLGRWGKIHLKNLLSLPDLFQVSLLCTRHSRPVAEQIPGIRYTDQWQQVVDSEVEAVVLAVPPHHHEELIRACILAGKAVLVEKPLAPTLAETQRIHDFVSSSGVPVLVDHIQLFNPLYQAAKEALRADGETPSHIICETTAPGPFRSYLSTPWDWLPHDLSLCLDLTGNPPVKVEHFRASPLPGPRHADRFHLELSLGADCRADIYVNAVSLHKNRRWQCFGEHHVYGFEERPGSKAATKAEWSLTERDQLPPEWSPRQQEIVTNQAISPLEQVLRCFHQGVAEGGGEKFGTDLALSIAQVCDQLNEV